MRLPPRRRWWMCSKPLPGRAYLWRRHWRPRRGRRASRCHWSRGTLRGAGEPPETMATKSERGVSAGRQIAPPSGSASGRARRRRRRRPPALPSTGWCGRMRPTPLGRSMPSFAPPLGGCQRWWLWWEGASTCRREGTVRERRRRRWRGLWRRWFPLAVQALFSYIHCHLFTLSRATCAGICRLADPQRSYESRTLTWRKEYDWQD